jgi:type I restriction enzyme M protein
LPPEEVEKFDYQAEGALYLPETARFSYLLDLAEGQDIGKAINDAMAAVEVENDKLKGVLPRSYGKIESRVLIELLRLLSGLGEIEGDAFGKIYEYFLGKFAMAEGQKGGVFYTPTSIVKLIVEIIEPFHGQIFDPACGSGGMFVQSALFVGRHKKRAADELTVFGTEKANDTVKLAKMNLAVHGISGDIRESNTYYEDPHKAVKGKTGRFDFVMANPPFNVSGVDKERIKDDPRFPFGIQNTDNANYLWIQLFYSALNNTGRAGFVMANSAGDARGTELEIRKKLIQSGGVDVIVSVGPNFFYTVTLPCTLWFFDKAKAKGDRKDKVLFIDARGTYRQVSRAIRDFLPEQIEFLANIVRLFRGEAVETESGSDEVLTRNFPDGRYSDIAECAR